MAVEDAVKEPLKDVARSLKPVDSAVTNLLVKGYGYSSVLQAPAQQDGALVVCAEVEGALSATMAAGKAASIAGAELAGLRKFLVDRGRLLIAALRRFNLEFGKTDGTTASPGPGAPSVWALPLTVPRSKDLE